MVRHGHAAAAIEYLTEWSEEGEFPYHAAQETLSYAKDDDTRRDILRSAMRAWHRRADSGWHSFQSFLPLFRRQWRLLPEEEARDEIRRIVRVITERPNERLTGSFGGPRGTVTFASYRPSLLFELLGPLKRLDHELADTVIRENPELARAADMYPYGHDIDIDRGLSNQRCPPKRWSSGKGTGPALHSACDSSAWRMRRRATSGTRSITRFAPSPATPTRSTPTPRRASAGRQAKTFGRSFTPPAGMTSRAAPASSIASPIRRSACSRRSSMPQELRDSIRSAASRGNRGAGTRRR